MTVRTSAIWKTVGTTFLIKCHRNKEWHFSLEKMKGTYILAGRRSRSNVARNVKKARHFSHSSKQYGVNRIVAMTEVLRKGNYRFLDPIPRTSQNAERARRAFDSQLKRSVSNLMRLTSCKSE